MSEAYCRTLSTEMRVLRGAAPGAVRWTADGDREGGSEERSCGRERASVRRTAGDFFGGWVDIVTKKLADGVCCVYFILEPWSII